ncbi:hypothetical protein ACI3L1_06760 [Deinococcus sp. SM5_A1]|uniref:hypothetical protein n=1 Tax=Deinococcus sp. SM5_A1 TaxID=3379094 RepID=UPI00385FC208
MPSVLFRQQSRTSPPIRLPDESPFVPPLPVSRFLGTPLPERVPSIGVNMDALTSTVEYTDGWGVWGMGLPKSLSNFNDVRNAAPTAYQHADGNLYGCSASAYQWTIALYRMPLASPSDQVEIGTWNLVLRNEVVGQWHEIDGLLDSTVARSLDGFTVYQVNYYNRQYVPANGEVGPFPPDEEYIGVYEHHIGVYGAYSLQHQGWMPRTSDGTVDATHPDGIMWSGTPDMTDVGIATKSGQTLRPVPQNALLLYDLTRSAWLPYLDFTAVGGGRTAYQGGPPPPTYSLTGTVTERVRLKGKVTLLRLDALPTGLLSNWPIRDWPDVPAVDGGTPSTRPVGVLPHAQALLTPDEDRAVWDAYPPGSIVHWDGASRMRTLQGEPAWHFKVSSIDSSADALRYLGTLSLLGLPEWAMPAPLTGLEQYPTGITVSGGTLSPEADPHLRLQVPALTDRLTSRVAWSIPAGSYTLEVTFPPAPGGTQRSTASFALRAPWQTPDLTVLVNVAGVTDDIPNLTGRTWIQRTVPASDDPSGILVSTPVPITLHLAQFSVLRTLQAPSTI